MDKKIVIAIVLIVIVLGAGIIYFKFNNNKIIDNNQSKHFYPLRQTFLIFCHQQLRIDIIISQISWYSFLSFICILLSLFLNKC